MVTEVGLAVYDHVEITSHISIVLVTSSSAFSYLFITNKHVEEAFTPVSLAHRCHGDPNDGVGGSFSSDNTP